MGTHRWISGDLPVWLCGLGHVPTLWLQLPHLKCGEIRVGDGCRVDRTPWTLRDLGWFWVPPKPLPSTSQWAWSRKSLPWSRWGLPVAPEPWRALSVIHTEHFFPLSSSHPQEGDCVAEEGHPQLCKGRSPREVGRSNSLNGLEFPSSHGTKPRRGESWAT